MQISIQIVKIVKRKKVNLKTVAVENVWCLHISDISAIILNRNSPEIVYSVSHKARSCDDKPTPKIFPLLVSSCTRLDAH